MKLGFVFPCRLREVSEKLNKYNLNRWGGVRCGGGEQQLGKYLQLASESMLSLSYQGHRWAAVGGKSGAGALGMLCGCGSVLGFLLVFRTIAAELAGSAHSSFFGEKYTCVELPSWSGQLKIDIIWATQSSDLLMVLYVETFSNSWCFECSF